MTAVRVIVYSFLRNQAVISHALHTTQPQCDLMEFFDHKDNWGAKNVKVGKINYVCISDTLLQLRLELNMTVNEMHWLLNICSTPKSVFACSVALSCVE